MVNPSWSVNSCWIFLCNIEIENEQHTICTCSLYNDERHNIYKNVNILNFNAHTASEKFISLMKREPNKLGKFSWNWAT